MGGDKWTTVKHVHTALRSAWHNENQDEGQARGWERPRPGPSPHNDPPQYDPRLAYGNSQRLHSDPGPYHGNGSWQPQGWPSSSYNQDCQGAQYQPGFGPQGYTAPATAYPNQGTNSQAYGQNQGHIAPQPPTSYPPYNPAYQQQPMASEGQSHQGGQSAYPYGTYPQNSGQPAGSSHSLPHHPRHGSQNTQDSNQSPTFPEQSYHRRPTGGPLNRTATAPVSLPCEHGHQRDNCPYFECSHGYRAGR